MPKNVTQGSVLERSKRDLSGVDKEAVAVALTGRQLLEVLDKGEIVRRVVFDQIRQDLLTKPGFSDRLKGLFTMFAIEAEELGRADVDISINADPEHIARAVTVLEELSKPEPNLGGHSL